MLPFLDPLPSHNATGDIGYALLHRDDEATNEKPIANETRSSRSHLKPMLKLCLIISCSSLALVVLISAIIFTTAAQRPPYNPDVVTQAPCGNTPEEAKSKGCVFEPLMSAWIPQECSSKQAMDEYAEVVSTFRWFKDEDLKEEITDPSELHQVHIGNYTEIWTLPVGHDIHCLFTWRKLALALDTNQKLIDSRTIEAHHTNHCARDMATYLQRQAGLLPDDVDAHSASAAYPLIFHHCVPIPYFEI